MSEKLVLSLLEGSYGICRLESGLKPADLPPVNGDFYSVAGTDDETSLVCREELMPAGYPAEKDFRVFKVEGPLAFNLTGILASLLQPLANAGIAVFTVSTYDTDYILVRNDQLSKAIDALSDVAQVKQP